MTAAVILAAGASTRLGRPKQLLPYRGTTLLGHAATAACQSACDRVIVVLGAHADDIRTTLSQLPVLIEVNPHWQEGMASSIRLGVERAEANGCTSALLMVCDQPGVSAPQLDQLVFAHRASAGPVASRYGGVLGVPAVFGRASFPALRALQGGAGARDVLRGAAHVTAIDWPDGARDIDTPDDLARL